MWHIHPVSCFLLMSLAVPSIPFMLQSQALPCLVLAGCLVEDSGASHSRTELCWKPVHSDGQQQIQLHLSLAVKPAVWTWRWEGTGGVERVHVNACLCACLSGGWRLQWRGTDWDVRATRSVYVWRRERGEKGRSQSAAAERVSRCYCMSPRPMNLQQERHNTSLDAFPLPALICFGCFLWGFWFKGTIDGSQVKMSVLSSLTSCLHIESRIFFSRCSSILMTVSALSFFTPFISQIAECRRLEQCQIHLRMWNPSPGPPHPLCLLHPRLSAKQPIAMLHSPLPPVNQVRMLFIFHYFLRFI